MRYLLALVVLIFVVANPAYAKWPTTIWTVLEEPTEMPTDPKGQRKLIAQKYKESLEHASFWFQSMSFKAPHQLNDEKSLRFKGNERYLAVLKKDTLDISSSQESNGEMLLSTHPGFLKPEGSLDELFSAAAVHELFHGIQGGSPEYYKYSSTTPVPGSKDCGEHARGDQWLTEGSASAVQIQYLERANGYVYGHPFNGSTRANWVRFFDQPLDWGRFPPEYRTPAMSWTQQLSWQCSYGTWYFWYAVGNMLGSKDSRDWRRTAYLRYIFEQKGDWQGTGLAMVDSGLKQAAQELDSIGTYQGGLFSLYPQFVAQYLDVDRFYEKVEKVTLTTPSLYETTSSLKGGPIAPVASRAWRFRVQLPRDATPMPYTVRFVLGSPDKDSLEGLHLIVDSKVVDRPSDPTVPYSHTRRTDQDMPNTQGELEYFVRIANVAHNAETTQPADFTLRVEVEGFYGGKSTGPSDDAIAGELRPGFEITGPGKYWTCSGRDDARAAFTIITPDGHADQLERVLPQGFKNLENDFDNAELQAHDKGQDAKLKRIQRQRKKFESNMQAEVQSSGVLDEIARAADESRRGNETNILAKLYGTNDQGECNVMFSVTLPGRQSAAQKVSGEHFTVMVTPESVSDLRTALIDFAGTLDFSNIDLANLTEGQLEEHSEKFTRNNPLVDFDEPDSDWTSCGTNEKNCDVGVLTLEHASHDHLSGTFSFQVSRRNDTTNRMEYDNVTGILNITSAQTQSDNSLIDFMSRGQQLGETMYAPGIERLLQGGSMFGE